MNTAHSRYLAAATALSLAAFAFAPQATAGGLDVGGIVGGVVGGTLGGSHDGYSGSREGSAPRRVYPLARLVLQ